MSLGGATEASIWSILYPITMVDAAWKSIPYGQPLRNQHFFVFNERLEPCPVWVHGQLYIAGIGLAKGYWKDEEQTKARFFEHPQTGIPLYRTGDLGRYLPDGTIEFLGREDTQVKLQGHRIELGEIEATLARHPVVRAAVANVVTEPHGDKRLVAYVILQSEDQTRNNGHYISPPVINMELSRFLKERLPAYMVPSAIIIVGSFPLTANGKLDRQNLPLPEIQSSGNATGYVAPTSEIERKIAAVWQEVLALEKVGLHDNFFDLGGNSLLMVQVYTKLHKILSRDISIIEMFFQYPTIHTLAKFLIQAQHTQTDLEESANHLHKRIGIHKTSVQQQRKVRLSHRTTDRN
jgi:hypothetical protein